ncbi:MAG: hypothetical protein JWL84_4991, partial [Rhodospirillales bacterium]|nr:hypothetical protein [Rhodospirillales bacterium]
MTLHDVPPLVGQTWGKILLGKILILKDFSVKMPRYAAKPYTLPGSTIHIFQRAASRKGTFYWRFARKGGGWHTERSSGIAAPIEDPCKPPYAVIQMAVADHDR